MANLQDDLGAAIVTTINDNASAFPLGDTGGTVHAEYAGQEVNYNGGASGRCLVKPEPEEPVEGTDYAESCQSWIMFALEFDLLDVFDSANARSMVSQGLRTAFRDRGAAMWANFTDNGSNIPGGGAKLELRDVVEEASEDPDRPKVVARIGIKAWAKLPAA